MKWLTLNGVEALDDLAKALDNAIAAGVRRFQSAQNFSDVENDVLLMSIELRRTVEKLRDQRRA